MEFHFAAHDFVQEQRGKLRDAYKVGKRIGHGAYSSVHALVHRESKAKRAVKVIAKKKLKTDEERKMIFRELGVLRRLDHPNVVKLYEYFQDDKSFYVVTELCEGGELFDKIIEDGFFSEARAAEYMK